MKEPVALDELLLSFLLVFPNFPCPMQTAGGLICKISVCAMEVPAPLS